MSADTQHATIATLGPATKATTTLGDDTHPHSSPSASLPSDAPPPLSSPPLPTVPYRTKENIVIFWPSTEPFRALWDPAPRFGFGWVLPASPSSLRNAASGSPAFGAGDSRTGEVRPGVGEGLSTSATQHTNDDGEKDNDAAWSLNELDEPTTTTRAHMRMGEGGDYPKTRRRTVVVAGVFPPYTSVEEARYVLRWRGVPHPSEQHLASGYRSATGTQNASGLGSEHGESSGKRDGASETNETEGPGDGNDSTGAAIHASGKVETEEGKTEGRSEGHGRAEPSVFALNALAGGGEIEVVLYERHEPGTLRYWEVEPPPPLPPSHLTMGGSPDPLSTTQSTPTPFTRRRNGSQTIPVALLNASPSLAARVEGRKVRAYRPAAAVVLALFGAVLRPVLSLLSLVVSWFGRAVGMGSSRVENGNSGAAVGVKGGEGERARRLGRALAKLGRKSAVVKQIRERAGQVDGLLKGVDALTRGDGGEIGRVETETRVYVGWYNRFFNALWLILNDLTLGLAVGSFLTENAVYLAGHVDPLILTMKDALPKALEWLDSWPAGLKLNSDLSAWYVRVLGVCVAEGGPGALLLKALPEVSTPTILTAAGYVSSMLGLSFLLALVVDVGVGLGCAGVMLGYAVARVGYVVAKEALGGLGALFRGKRYNALRHRMDTHDYDIDQLLFGTMLFTLVAFLSPTAVAFYFLFAGTRLLTLLVQASLEIILAFVNSFPLFLLVLKIKDGKRIPAGVILLPVSDAELVRTGLVDASIPSAGDKNELNWLCQAGVVGVLRLESQPRAVGWVFGTYRRMWERLVGHYNPLRLGLGVARGVWLGGLGD